MLREKVGNVMGAGDMVDAEEGLSYSIADPVYPHVDRLGPLGADHVCGQPLRTLVVDNEGGRRLGVSETLKDGAELTSYLPPPENSTILRFSC